MSLLALLFEDYAAITPGAAYWVDEDEADGETYCLRCVKAKAAGRRYSSYGCAPEQDGCLHCAKCGTTLDYVLTEHGAEAELAHFKTVKFRRDKPLDRDTAYHLARLIAAKEDSMDVVRIAAKAIRCMTRIPSGSR